LDASVAQLLPGTENGFVPFWSPDSRFIGFFADDKLKKISVSGGLPQVLCDAPGTASGAGLAGSWSPDGTILFGHVLAGPGDLYRVSAAGGTPTVSLESDKSRQEHLTFPYFLPDGRHFLYLDQYPQPAQSMIYLASLDAKERRPIVAANSQIAYSRSGHILFVQGGKLMAQPFDARRGQTTADAFPVVDQVANFALGGNGAFSVSHTGILAFREGGGDAATRLLWFDRNGKQVDAMEAPGFNIMPSLSPDEQRVAVTR